MDTHLDTRLNTSSLPEMASQPQAVLPGEGRQHAAAPGIGVDPDGRPGGVSRNKSRRRGRTILLATAAVLVVSVAGGVFLLSPYNHLVPVNTARIEAQARQIAASAGITLPPIVAPAARLATAPRPEVKPVYRQDVQHVDAGEQMREILGYHDAPAVRTTSARGAPRLAPSEDTHASTGEGRPEQASAKPVLPAAAPAPRVSVTPAPTAETVGVTPVIRPAAPVVTPSPPSDMAVAEPGMAPPPAPTATPVPSVATSTPPAPVPAAEPVSPTAAVLDDVRPQGQRTTLAALPSAAPAAPQVPATSRDVAPAPADPAATATLLRPAPMARGEQIDVLNLVAQLGVVIRDLRTENAALRSRVQSSVEKVDGAVADFERRLALAEARGAMNAAMGVEAPPTSSASSTGATIRTVSLTSAPAGARSLPPPSSPSGPAPRRYRVTAASPGLAMLSELDRSGGEGSQLQVQVGDDVPGYGRISAIRQRGTAWSVVTDRGAIE